MQKQVYAIALCRVSSREQLENNSLNRQRDAVLKAAQDLNVEFIENGWWSGSISSKKGNNLNRKDIHEMLRFCEGNKQIKYLIIDEPDRFMRSIEEAMYYEMEFKRRGVKVWYACDNALNTEDMNAKLMRFLKYFVAEGSNEERQRKSISGQIKALQEGRYPFSPKPGYIRGRKSGIQELHPVRGPILRDLLLKMCQFRISPTAALVELNKSSFMKDHAPYKMDKFRNIATDSFYAGIVEIHKQVNFRNENGLHEAIITKDQHEILLDIFNAKPKTQKGPRKNGNPKYPLSNLVNCDKCASAKNGRFVGFDHGNGKNANLIYEKYRCRSCGMYLTRGQLHEQIKKVFNEHPILPEGIEYFIECLENVWNEKEQNRKQDVARAKRQIKDLAKTIEQRAIAAIDPTNAVIKENILESIEKLRQEKAELTEALSKSELEEHTEYDEFLRFAYGFVKDIGKSFLDQEVSQENRLKCKQLIFPAGFNVNEQKIVYTPEVSILIRLADNKKDAKASNSAHLVRVTGL